MGPRSPERGFAAHSRAADVVSQNVVHLGVFYIGLEELSRVTLALFFSPFRGWSCI